MPDARACERTRAACRHALEEHDDIRPLWRAWRSGDAVLAEARSLLPDVRAHGPAMSRLLSLKQRLAQAGMPVGDGALERFLIVAAAAESIGRIDGLPVDDRVRYLFLQNFEMYAAGSVAEPFDIARSSFVAMSRIATLSRYPAGQLDWEVSGVPRSWILRTRLYAFPRLLQAVVAELHGLGPLFFSDVHPNRRSHGALLERESLRSYHRMAGSMALQPAIRGVVTSSSFHAPDTGAVSPHVVWLNDMFKQNGAYIVPVAGAFAPTEALVIWPRSAMLYWARGYAELHDDASGHRMLAAQGAAV